MINRYFPSWHFSHLSYNAHYPHSPRIRFSLCCSRWLDQCKQGPAIRWLILELKFPKGNVSYNRILESWPFDIYNLYFAKWCQEIFNNRYNINVGLEILILWYKIADDTSLINRYTNEYNFSKKGIIQYCLVIQTNRNMKWRKHILPCYYSNDQMECVNGMFKILPWKAVTFYLIILVSRGKFYWKKLQ